MNLSTEQADHLNDLLADSVMDNVEQITKILRDGTSAEERSQICAAQDAALQEKLKAELGPERYSQFEDYIRNLLATLTTEQFMATLPADQTLSPQQSNELLQILKEETGSAIFTASHDCYYLTIPILTFQKF